MTNVPDEVKNHYLSFSADFPKKIQENVDELQSDDLLVQSYARVAALNGLKVDVLSELLPEGVKPFIYEAHNDALLSHMFAAFGSWRTAMQSLRSCLENTLAAIYFYDHVVELEQWVSGDFILSQKFLREYCSRHPRIRRVGDQTNLFNELNEEYGTLSKAVHASSALFRMTDAQGQTCFAKPNAADLGKWSTRERKTLNLCTVMLVSAFHKEFEGARIPQIRSALSLTLSPKSRDALREQYSINVPAPTN